MNKPRLFRSVLTWSRLFALAIFGGLILLVSILVPYAEATHDSPESRLHEKALSYFRPVERHLDPVEDSREAHLITLGEKLFFETALSPDYSISCQSCHKLENGGVDNLPVSSGFQDRKGVRNTPSVYNSSMQIGQFWDARVRTLEDQAAEPIGNVHEMGGLSESDLVLRLSGSRVYTNMFANAFPDAAAAISLENTGIALAAFQSTLVTPTRFDEYLSGRMNALDENEKRGLRLVIETGCVPCHSGPGLGGHQIQQFGLFAPYAESTHSANVDEGRFLVTGDVKDKNRFKVPVLRNVSRTAPYFHDGSVAELAEAVRIMARVQLNTELNDEDVNSIVAFLSSLDGSEYWYKLKS